MCGISVVVGRGDDDGIVTALAAMHARAGHRGPDGENFAVVKHGNLVTGRDIHALREGLAPSDDWCAGMAFRWLQITDSDPGASQPMLSPDGRVVLLFNGEIYNHPELRSELSALGFDFRTRSDTEVVLAAYMQWGVRMFERLNGMWAVVIVDRSNGSMLLSRDRFGIKPLYYARHRGHLLLASEVKQIIGAGMPPVANTVAVRRLCDGLRPRSAEETFFEGINSLPAASYATIDLRAPLRDPVFQSYWTLPVEEAGMAMVSVEDAANSLFVLLSRSIAEHMTGPAPIGILISGGLDSSLMASLALPAYAARGEALTGISMISRSDRSQFDDTPHMATLEQALGIRGNCVRLTAEWLKSSLTRVTWAQEEPVAGIAVAGQFLAYEHAASLGCRIVLDGQGADEMFGGYPRHQLTYLRDCLASGNVGDLFATVWALMRDEPRMFARAVADMAGRQPSGKLTGFIRAAHSAHPDESGGDGRSGLRITSPIDQRSRLAGVLRRDVLAGNLRAVLGVTDRNAMAHSIEARVPYVDRRIAEFAFSLSGRFKLGEGQRKRVMRLLGERHLPAGIVTRKDRIGFGAPALSWLRSHFQDEMAELSGGRVFGQAQWVDRDRLSEFVRGFREGSHDDAGTVWRLIAIENWARAYAVTGV